MKTRMTSLFAIGLSISLMGCPADNALVSTDQSPTASAVPETGLSIEFQNKTYFESTIKAGINCFQKSGLDGAVSTGNALAAQLEGAANDAQREASLTGIVQVLLRSQANFKLNCL